ncbi:MAG: hypothetical protein Q9227_007596 [Pyrenula ochraceoflavens]
MPLPPVATFAACGSLITACKSAWELSRMVKNKKRDLRVEKEVHAMLDDLEDYVDSGILPRREYRKFRFIIADALDRKEATPGEARKQIMALEDALNKLVEDAENDSSDSDSDEEPGRHPIRAHPPRAIRAPPPRRASTLSRSNSLASPPRIQRPATGFPSRHSSTSVGSGLPPPPGALPGPWAQGQGPERLPQAPPMQEKGFDGFGFARGSVVSEASLYKEKEP